MLRELLPGGDGVVRRLDDHLRLRDPPPDHGHRHPRRPHGQLRSRRGEDSNQNHEIS